MRKRGAEAATTQMSRMGAEAPVGISGRTSLREYNFWVSLASSAQLSVPQKWRRPVRQRSRLVRRTGPAHARGEFAHPSAQEFARFLDYYRIRWVSEPVSFPVGWEAER